MSPRNQKDPQSNAESRADQSGLSLTQIAASAAAASSAAFAASYLGVAGTIIGAAVASVVATVASSMYSASLRRSREAVRRTAGQFGSTWVVTAPAPPVPASSPAPVPLQPVENEPAGTQVLEPVVEIAPEPPREDVPGIRWGRVLPVAAAVLAITLGALTGVEAVLGKPLSALLGGDASGTTISSVTGSGGTKKAPATSAGEDAPRPTPSADPTPTADPTAEPTEEPTTEPTEEPTEEPTAAPTEQPTAEPTGTPTSTPPATP